MFKWFKKFSKKKEIQELKKGVGMEKDTYNFKYRHLCLDNVFWSLVDVMKKYTLRKYELTELNNQLFLVVGFNDKMETTFVANEYLLQVVQMVNGNSVSIYRIDINTTDKNWSRIYDKKLKGYKECITEIFEEKIKIYLFEQNF